MRLVRWCSDESAVLGAFALLLLTVPAHLWAAGADLPLGGPNVYAGGLTVLACGTCAIFGRSRAGTLRGLVEPFVPIVPVLVTGALLAVWATFVYLSVDTLLPKRVPQMVLGLSLLWSVFYCVTTSRRAHALVLAIVLATFVSTLFGFGIAFYGDPFLTIWLQIADNVRPKTLYEVLRYKRLAGLGPDPIAFSYQLAVAVPLAFALVLYGWPRKVRFRRLLDVLTGIALMVMVTAMVANSSRSMIVGVALGTAAVSVMYLVGRRSIARLAVLLCLIAAWTTVFFNPTLAVDRFIFPAEPRIAVRDRGVLDDAPRGSFEWKLARAYEALLLADQQLQMNARLFKLVDDSTRPRPHMVTAAIRYSLDFPLGTGTYFPSERHLDPGLDDYTRHRVLTGGPHNQFLIILVYYGFPGLMLLVAFYWYMVRTMWPPFLQCLRPAANQPAFLVPAVLGAMVAYTFNSLLHNNGPFVGDWYHFILIGLLFAVPRVLGTRSVAERKMEADAISTPSGGGRASDPIRLLLVSPLPPPPGGIQTWTQILVERGMPAPFEFEVVDTRVTRRHQDVPPRLNRLELTRFLNILRSIWRALSPRRFALMHLNCALTRTATPRNVVSTWIARFVGVPYVIHLHGTFDPPMNGGLVACLYRIAYRMMFEGAAWILALGGPSHRGVQQLGEFTGKTTSLMPNFIDRRDIPTLVGSADGRPPTALFSGALTAAKGIHTVVAAAKQLADMHFVMVGDGPPDSRTELFDLIGSLGIEDRVTVLEPVPRTEVLAMLAESDVFVFPSTTEGFPNSVAEAMAVGLPVVASPVGAIPEMIDVPDGGFLVPWDDVAGYVRALGRLRDSTSLREQMGTYNRAKALREYDYDVVVERLCSVYRHVLERQGT